jgi:nucleotide-binding universal stress UspA family protein
MKKVVIVPVDGSRFAEQALPVAVALARATGADLELLRVHPVLPPDLPEREASEYLEETARHLEPVLPGRVHKRPIPEHYGVAVPLSSAWVVDALRARAAEPDVQLVVMATHGFGGVTRAWLGSVADAVIRESPRPVLLVRPTDEDFSLAAAADRGFHHILIPLDGSSTAEKVVPQALELGAALGARFTLLRVMSPLSWQLPPAPYPPITYAPMSDEAALAYLEGMAAPMRASGAEVAVHVVQGASPAGLIVKYARDHGVDLITLATHGAGGFQRMLLGSIADKVVRSSDVPVMVFNARKAGDEQLATAAAAAAHA